MTEKTFEEQFPELNDKQVTIMSNGSAMNYYNEYILIEFCLSKQRVKEAIEKLTMCLCLDQDTNKIKGKDERDSHMLVNACSIYDNIQELLKTLELKEVVEKAQCPKCGTRNIHYTDGCLDCGYNDKKELGLKDNYKSDEKIYQENPRILSDGHYRPC